jgi:prephenate dehydrogenase
MTTQITIIGLGQIGGSIGLALASHKERVRRVGHDKDPEAARAAMKAGAVDSINFNLPASVEQADIVILAMPLNEVRDTLGYIRQDVRQGAVVMDTSPAKREVEAWAREILPRGVHYIGLAPAINPSHLQETGGGLYAAHDDLFKEADFLVCLPSGAPGEVAQLGLDLVRMLGATPIISEAAEADGLLASVVTLPRLLTVSLMDATVNKPGWRDASNLAGRSYGTAVAAAFDRDEADALVDSAFANRENVVRVMDGYISSLRELRDRIESDDRATVKQMIRKAYKDGYDWLAERHIEKYIPVDRKDAKDKVNHPDLTMGARLRQLFFGKLFSKPPKPGADER